MPRAILNIDEEIYNTFSKKEKEDFAYRLREIISQEINNTALPTGSLMDSELTKNDIEIIFKKVEGYNIDLITIDVILSVKGKHSTNNPELLQTKIDSLIERISERVNRYATSLIAKTGEKIAVWVMPQLFGSWGK